MKGHEEIEAAERQHAIAHARRFDVGKVIDGCDGAFEPENRMLHGDLHPGKTREDHMPVASRPRVIAAQKRVEKMRK